MLTWTKTNANAQPRSRGDKTALQFSLQGTTLQVKLMVFQCSHTAQHRGKGKCCKKPGLHQVISGFLSCCKTGTKNGKELILS